MTDEAIRQEVSRRPGYYAILPARVRYDKRLAPMERIMYAEITALAQADGSCWARNQYFCNLYGVAEPTVRRWVASLQKYGYISSELMTKNNKIVGRRITLVSQPAETAQNRADGAKNDAETAQNRAAYNRYNNTSNNNTPLPPKGECDESERMFGIFWSAYPRKADKKKAIRAWGKIKHLDNLFPRLMEALERQKQTEQWAVRGIIPLPSTWLNGERWEDDLTGQPTQAQRPGGAPAPAYEEVHRAL